MMTPDHRNPPPRVLIIIAGIALTILAIPGGAVIALAIISLVLRI
ncbi:MULTISPECIES: hypothetical protein [Corynebacterium]|nr:MULTISPECIES: hypothetical protein [Corynebacterium]